MNPFTTLTLEDTTDKIDPVHEGKMPLNARLSDPRIPPTTQDMPKT